LFFNDTLVKQNRVLIDACYTHFNIVYSGISGRKLIKFLSDVEGSSPFNPYVAIGGVFAKLKPQTHFLSCCSETAWNCDKAFVTFPEYMWAQKMLKNFFSDISTSISNMAAGKWTSD